MRRASAADRPAIEAFLQPRAVTAMFPLSNLARHGMDGAHGRSMSFWLSEGKTGLTDVLGCTRAGMVMPNLERGRWGAAARALSGREVIGVIGAAQQARPLIAALGIADVAMDMDDDDPQFLLEMADLVVPDGPGALVPLSKADRETVTTWLRLYQEEAFGSAPDKAAEKAALDYEAYAAADTHRVLMSPEGPLAMTGFNAEIPDMVQVGGVYTPIPLRGRGLARRAVALHLTEARARGATRATLFAANTVAARAYEAIGFSYVGEWTIFMTTKPERIGG